MTSGGANRTGVTGQMAAEPADDAAGARVLVVDDEPNLVEVVSMALRFQGFSVETAATGREAIAAVNSFKPHLMVLDVMLPDIEGFEVARRLGAQRAGVPIIFLTARDSTEDKVRGLSGGGDDYMTKPFSLEELVARIRTILRRTGQAAPDSGRLVFGDLELDEESREVSRGGVPIELTATEYRLLRYLMLNPRRVMTRAQLLDHVNGRGAPPVLDHQPAARRGDRVRRRHPRGREWAPAPGARPRRDHSRRGRAAGSRSGVNRGGISLAGGARRAVAQA